MKVVIRYCNSWAYRPQASRVEDEIMSAYKDAVVELVAGARGEFSVEVDGKMIFSNKNYDDRRFPNSGEIVELISKV